MGSVPRLWKSFFLVPDLSFSGSTELENMICKKDSLLDVREIIEIKFELSIHLNY